MNVQVTLGGHRQFRLEQAVLIYREYQEVVAILHDVRRDGKPSTEDLRGAPCLGAGRLVTMDFLSALAEGLGTRLAPEVLPDNVIWHASNVTAWWTPPHRRPMWFREGSELGRLSGKHFPIPSLLWKLVGNALHVRALREACRPTADTPLCFAPFWNTNEAALVCQGTMKRPETSALTQLAGWVDGYFGAQFTHAFGNRRLTSHPGGYKALLSEIAGGRRGSAVFPVEYLVDAKETVAAFLQRGAARA